MDTGSYLHAAGAAGGVDPAALRFRQWQHGRRLLAEIEQIRAAESELAARRFRLVAELARDYPAPIEFARNDIAPALHITDIEAYQLLERAATFTTVLPETLAALGAGRIGEAQATAVADAVADTSPAVAAVVDRFAVAAMDNEPLTDRQVYRRAHRQVLKLDPPAAERHHRQQRQARTLARRLSADGMATLRMYATAQDVAAVWDTCTLLADAAPIPGDDRDIGNHRVDALFDLLTSVLDTGSLPSNEPTEAAPDQPADNDAADHIDASESAGVDDWLRWAEQFDDEPDSWNYDDRVADVGADPADDAAWVCPADLAARFAKEDAWLAGATEVRLATTLTDRRPEAGRRHRKPFVSQRSRTPARGSSVLMNVTVPIDLLLGDHTAVADIPGLGPITAGQVTTLLDHATLRRILCDPVSGEVLNVGRTRYTPTPAISRHVKTRDQTCVVPGCEQPAGRCDIDHRQPFSTGGPTAVHNLNMLCRHHHRATVLNCWTPHRCGTRATRRPRVLARSSFQRGGGFHLARTDTGWEWTTALGRTYTRPVTPLYEPGDNYWPLNIRQTDGHNPDTLTEAPAPEDPPPPVALQISDLPDDPPF